MQREGVANVVNWLIISIHAPIVGCDLGHPSRLLLQPLISIHAPIVGCDEDSAGVEMDIQISIHAPIVGCDMTTCYMDFSIAISIHAPIVGCDVISSALQIKLKNFNPRTHRGVRQLLMASSLIQSLFQSTHPSWGATLNSHFLNLSNK